MTAFIPEEKISEIRHTANIVDIVSEAVLLKRAGNNLLGLCPFHTEKTPSFTVSPQKQIFYCFGCGTGGNVFSFLMRHHQMSFPEAARHLAERYGIDLPARTISKAEQRRASKRERLLALNKRVMAFYCQKLHSPRTGDAAQRYFTSRRLSTDTLQVFNLGYAPQGWQNLTEFLSHQGLAAKEACEVGLIAPREQRSGYYDRFRNRIMFPIMDVRQQVVGFGGRVMDDSLPKYLNSPESAVFSKSRCLYGIERAWRACRGSGDAFVVEGYTDVLAMHQAGITNTVATLGTALTTEHIRLLRGYARRLILVFDADAAGIKAATRSVELFMREEMDARIMVLPYGYDPDAYVNDHGADTFLDKASQALGLITFLMEMAVQKHGTSIEGKLKIVAEMLAPLAAVSDQVARSLYVKALAERIGLDEKAIQAKIRSFLATTKAGPPRQQSADAPSPEQIPDAGGSANSLASPRKRLERRIVAMMLQVPDVTPEVARRKLIETFEDQQLKMLGQHLLANTERDIAVIINALEQNDLKRLAASLAMEEETWHQEGCLKLIKQFELTLRRRGDQLLAQIRAAEKNNDHKLLMQLLKEKQHQVGKSRGA